MASELDTNDTNALLNEIDKLKQRLEGVDRAKARIEKWYNRVVKKGGDTDGQMVEKATLEGILRVFDEEGVK